MDVDLEEMDVDKKLLGEKSPPVSQDDRGRLSHEGKIDNSPLKNTERSSQHSRKRKGEDVSNENFQAKKPKRKDSSLLRSRLRRRLERLRIEGTLRASRVQDDFPVGE